MDWGYKTVSSRRGGRTVKVLLFAGLKQKVGSEFIELKVEDSLDVMSLRENIESAAPSLNGEVYMVAVNENFVRADYLVKAGDTVALIPPVSGG